MKLFVMCLFGVMVVSMASPPPPKPSPESTLPELPRPALPTVVSPPEDGRGCIYILGRCQSHCPVGTHAYTTGCSPKTPEATCDEPNPVQEKHAICDYSSCYCDAPTVRDTVSNKCVKPEDCPKKEEVAKKVE